MSIMNEVLQMGRWISIPSLAIIQRQMSMKSLSTSRSHSSQSSIKQLPLIRKGFMMSIFPGQAEEYQRRHSPIWKDLETTLKSHGAHNYSIFLNEKTYQLFGYVLIVCYGEYE